jgi:hypothetical protein
MFKLRNIFKETVWTVLTGTYNSHVAVPSIHANFITKPGQKLCNDLLTRRLKVSGYYHNAMPHNCNVGTQRQHEITASRNKESVLTANIIMANKSFQIVVKFKHFTTVKNKTHIFINT